MNPPTKPRLGSSVILVSDGKILLGRRNKLNANGLWVLPGGGVEYGETLEEAAVREAKEETGLDVKLKGLACFKEIIATHANYHSVVFFFMAEPIAGELCAGGDLAEVKYFSPEEIMKLNTVDSVKWALKDAGLLKM